MNNFFLRTLTGAVLVFILLGSVIFHPYTFTGLFLIITLLGMWEFFSLCEKDNIAPQKILGTLTGFFIFLYSALVAANQIPVVFLSVFLCFIFLIFVAELYVRTAKPFTNISYTLMGIFYVAVPFSLMNFIVFRDGIYTPHLLLGFFFILWANDTGAYLVGITFGKHRLFERISPKKSWEGSIGGMLISLATAYIISLFYMELSSVEWMIIAFIIVVAGTFGDLVESMFKRSIHCKDSGGILPGHGGILDRFDGLLLSAPLVFVYLLLFKG